MTSLIGYVEDGISEELPALLEHFVPAEVARIRYAFRVMVDPGSIAALPLWARLALQGGGVEIQLSVSPARWLRCEIKTDVRRPDPYFWTVEFAAAGVTNQSGWAPSLEAGLDEAAAWYADWLRGRGEV